MPPSLGTSRFTSALDVSQTMAIKKQASGELKTRVNSCLIKLSDRDTLPMAANELEAIARTLPNDAFAPFLNCLFATDSAEKSPVRRQCVRLLGVLSAAHGDALSPHLSRMVSTVLRRLRDPDSAVRAACVEAVSSITTHVKSPPFNAIMKPLADALFHEQDSNAQIGASLCLSAAVEATPEPDAAELRKLLPRVLKLVKSDSFKAKPGLLSFIGSIVAAGCVKSKTLFSSVVSTVIEFLSSKDWAARKAAAEVLERVVASEGNLAAEFKGSGVAALESRRFDTVKLVRETMNRALEMWKGLPGVSEDLSSPKDSSPVLLSGSPVSTGLETPQPRKMVSSRSPASTCSSTSNSQKSNINDDYCTPRISSAAKVKRNLSCLSKTNSQKSFSNDEDSKPCILSAIKLKRNLSCSSTTNSQKRFLNDEDSKSCISSASEPNLDGNLSCSSVTNSQKSFINDEEDSKPCISSASRLNLRRNLGSRVVPFNCNDNPSLVDGYAVEDNWGNEKELEDTSLIFKQLVQIENQQSNLLDLLQRFIGSSQKGMSSLEKRVDGLEKVLDEMSQDFAISSRRVSGTDSGGNTCCMIPGAEFLSPKFWRKAEGQTAYSKFCSSSRNQSIYDDTAYEDASGETSKFDSPRN